MENTLRVLIVSDVHEQTDALVSIVEHEKACGLDYVLDCGDRYNGNPAIDPFSLRLPEGLKPGDFGYVDLGVPTLFLRGNHEVESIISQMQASGDVNHMRSLNAGEVVTLRAGASRLTVSGLPGIYSGRLFNR